MVWVIFDRMETLASKESRKSLSKLLSKANTLDIVRAWPQSVIEVFDATFGERHLSWRCFLRSSIASVLLVSLLLIVTISTDQATAQFFLGLAQPPFSPHLVRLLFAWTLGTLIPDYLSLLETRYVLRQMRIRNQPKQLVVLLGVDFIATTIVARVGLMFVGFGILVANYYIHPSYTVSTALRNAWHFAANDLFVVEYFPKIGASYDKATGFIRLSTGAWLYASYLTSVWIWLHLAALLLLRLSPRVDKFLGRLRWLLDYRRQPFRAIGGVTALLIFLLFCLAWPILW
jgi:hypothetical protein